MDIAMNMLDQPRLVVPWDNLQALLAKEIERRHLPVETLDEWTKDMPGFYEGSSTAVNISDAEWYPIYGQDFMKTAREACPPESHARNSTLSSSSSQAQAEFLFKDPQAGFITNFNRSSDLCVVGPELLDKHGLLYAPSSKFFCPISQFDCEGELHKVYCNFSNRKPDCPLISPDQAIANFPNLCSDCGQQASSASVQRVQNQHQ